MATNVFGAPVTDDDVRGRHPHITTPTALDRAALAMEWMNAEEKATNVSTFVHNLKGAYGNGTSTLCMIYNATGGDLSFVRQHTWEGDVWRSPYPQIIQNGQWAGFLHVRWRVMGPSKEAFVYRGTNNAGAERQWMMAFNTSRRHFDNRVYTEIRAPPGFNNSTNWNSIDALMEARNNSDSATLGECFSSVTIGAGSSPEFVGIMNLRGPNSVAVANDDFISAIFPSLDSKYEDDAGVEDEEEEATPAAAAAAAAAATPAAAE